MSLLYPTKIQGIKTGQSDLWGYYPKKTVLPREATPQGQNYDPFTASPAPYFLMSILSCDLSFKCRIMRGNARHRVYLKRLFQNFSYLCSAMARAVEFDEEQAVQKAMEVFWKNGYAATSMRDLTEAMQINSSSLYNTLGDKRQLFIKSIKHYTVLRMRALKQFGINTDSPFQTLENFINEAVHIITTEPSSCMCVRTAFEIEGDDPEVQAVITAYDEFTHKFLKNLIESAQCKDEIAQSEDADTIAHYLNSTFAGWYNSYILHRDSKKIQNIADYLIRQLKK